MTLVTQAVIFAAQAHDGAARKGSEIPYIVHPMEVVAIASTMTVIRRCWPGGRAA